MDRSSTSEQSRRRKLSPSSHFAQDSTRFPQNSKAIGCDINPKFNSARPTSCPTHVSKIRDLGDVSVLDATIYVLIVIAIYSVVNSSLDTLIWPSEGGGCKNQCVMTPSRAVVNSIATLLIMSAGMAIFMALRGLGLWLIDDTDE